MRIPFRAAALCLAFAAAAAVPAQAQFSTVRVGQSVEGRLASRDPAMFQSGRFKVYQFRAQPGVRYLAALQSPDFDPILRLGRTVGGVTDYMQSDDDGGEGTNARLRFQVPSAGTYLLVAQAVGPNAMGAFTLTLDTVTVRTPSVRDVRVGETVRGELTEDDADLADPAAGQPAEGGDVVSGYYDLYRLRARAGQRLRIRVAMGEYVPHVAFGRMEDGEFVPLAHSEGTSGTLTLRVPETGEYHVQAGAFGEVTGEYTLAVQDRSDAAPPPATPLRRGQSVSATLREGDPELEDGRWHDAYAYTGRAGERVRITMTSDEFDTVLILGRVVDGEFQELASNDDAEGGDDTDSEIVFELPEDGRYVIQATSFQAQTEGAYRLTVRSGSGR